MKISTLALLLFGTVVACNGGGVDNGKDTNGEAAEITGGSCKWPDGVVAANDASTVGCFAQAKFEICQGSGSDDPNETCTDACKSSEYALGCDQTTPPPSLDCKVIPIPTPEGVLVYCCPCS